MDQKLKTRVIANLITAIFLLALCGEYGGSRLGIIDTLEKQSYDWRLKRESGKKHDRIVIVDIDRDTLRKYGNWPIPRDLFAQLNDQLLNNYQAEIIAYALPFSQSNDTALNVLSDITRELSDTLDETGEQDAILMRLNEKYDYDRHVIDSLNDKRMVLGFVFDKTGRVEGQLPLPMKFMDGTDGEMSNTKLNSLTQEWVLGGGVAGNLRSYMEAVGDAAGHINVNIDSDGIVRHTPYFVSYANGFYPSLPVALYQKLSGKPIVLNSGSDGLLGKKIIKSISIGNRDFPMDREGRMYVNYLGAGGRNVNFENTPEAAFRYVSFADVIDGKVPREDLSKKIIFVGSSAEQLPYLYASPLNPSLPAVEIIATQFANMVDDTLLNRDTDTLQKETLILFLLAILLSLLLAMLQPVFALLLIVVTIAGYMFFVLNIWESSFEVWSILPAIVTLVGVFVVNSITGFVAEWRANRNLQNTFGQYVPTEFAKKIGTSGKSINLEGEERELSILFSDVRNFTAISESLTPRELTLLMNRMLTALSEQIHKHGGTVDKYIGDAVMAFWNAPLYDEKHAENAVLAALDMQQAIAELAEDLKSKGFDKPLKLGVGVCTGNANVGNMGSALRMTYTAIGDTVNLASRSESLTKFYGCPILITETTHAQCKEEIACRAVDLVRVKGRQQPALLYEPVSRINLLSPDQHRLLEQFEEMRQLYTAGQFAQALEVLNDYSQKVPEDGLAHLYLERLTTLIQNPPAEWDGVLTHTSK